MAFSSIFLAYWAFVIGALAVVMRIWLPLEKIPVALGILAAWVAFVAAMSFSGVPGMYNRFPPGMVLLVAPVLLALLALTFGPAGRYLASHAPLTLLLGFQVFRTGVELSLHHLYVLGLAPKLITLEGGNIEILVAITAPLAAWASTAGRSGMRIAYVWNVIGILSLGNVVVRAVLTAPGPLHFIDGGVLDFAIITSPFTAIPGFMAPLALALHILAFRAFSHLGDKASGRP